MFHAAHRCAAWHTGWHTGRSLRSPHHHDTQRRAYHALLHQVAPAYHCHLQEILLGALSQVLTGWSEGRSLRLDVEGHGREDLFEPLDLSRTVGWFTTLFPLRLTARSGGPGAVLRAVKEQWRAVPEQGLGFGVLRYLADEETRSALRALPPAEVSFNFLGRLDLLEPGADAVPPGR